MSTTATTNQINYIATLFNEVKPNSDVPGVEDKVAPVHNQLVLAMAAHANPDAEVTLTKGEASDVITALKDAKALIAAHVPNADVRFRKLDDGSWGLFGDPEVVQTGAMVTVTKANGEQEEKLVGDIVATVGANVLAKVQRVNAKDTVSPLVEAFHARFGTRFARVALPNAESAQNDVSFWFIGEKYVYQVLGGSGRNYMPAKVQTSVITRLAAMSDDEVREAMAAYGRLMEHCGCCGKDLTNEESRERGIGPICWAKYGYAA